MSDERSFALDPTHCQEAGEDPPWPTTVEIRFGAKSRTYYPLDVEEAVALGIVEASELPVHDQEALDRRRAQREAGTATVTTTEGICPKCGGPLRSVTGSDPPALMCRECYETNVIRGKPPHIPTQGGYRP